MPLEPSINLGDISDNKEVLLEFRDSLQILLDDLFEKGHEEPNSNQIIATRSITQLAIPADVDAKVLYNLILQGDTGEYNTSVGRFQPTVDGNYIITASIELPNINIASKIYLVIKKNNEEVWKGAETIISASIIGMVNIEAGDFIEIYVRHNDASAQDSSASPSRTKFAGYKIP